jgi:hypothetical protein
LIEKVQNLKGQWRPTNPQSLAKQFRRLGWIGVLLQLALVSVPVILLIYVLLLSSPESAQRKGIDLSNYLSNGSLLVMVFTMFWFFRYTRLAKRIVDPESCPPQSSLMQTLWIGLGAGCVGIFFSMVLLMQAVGRLLFVLMATPQTGIPIATPLGDDPSTTVSAIDAVSLASLLVILSAELIVLALSLWLLFRVTRPSAEIAEETATAQDLDAHAQ